MPAHKTTDQDPDALPEWIQLVRDKVESLRYGAVLVTVHDGRVTQIERTEKTRILEQRPIVEGGEGI